MIDPEWTYWVDQMIDWLTNWYILGCKNVPWLRFHPKYEWVYFAVYVSVAIHFWVYRKRKMKVPPGYDQSPSQNYTDTEMIPYPAQLARKSGGAKLRPPAIVVMVIKAEEFRSEPDTIALPLRKIRGRKYKDSEGTTARLSRNAVSRIRKVSGTK